MKKILTLCAISLVCYMSQTQTIPDCLDKPAWECAADNILAAIEGLADALSNDSLLYDNWRGSLEQLCNEFDESDIVRQEIFASIRSGIEQTKAALENSRSSSEAAAAAAYTREQNLLNQLAALRLETQAEIAYLNRLLADVSHELAETQNAYTSLIQVNQTKADALMQSLYSARGNYETMVEKRTEFLELLDTLVTRTRSTLQTTITQAEDISQQIAALTDEVIES